MLGVEGKGCFIVFIINVGKGGEDSKISSKSYVF